MKHALVRVRDSGALDFVLAARMEAAIKKLVPSEKEFLLPQKPETLCPVNREARRYTRLYLPGNTPKMMINAGLHKPDGIILDLEDSVAPEKKDEARLLVRNALREVNFFGAERMVRINQVPSGLKDLQYIVAHNVQVILIPKCEDARQVNQVNDEITALNPGDPACEIYLMPILESAMGIENAFAIACGAGNIVALAIGLEDLTSDLGVERTKKGTESFYARTRVVNACKAAGIDAVDSVFSDVADEEGLIEAVRESKSLGFSGMGCIHPRQVQTILNGFLPGRDEILRAMKIVLAWEEAHAAGQGVVALGTKMIDAPVVKRAVRIIGEAVDAGLIPVTWREEHE
jgi:citrate lyase subunit beta/citryl-CoA lyase